MAERADDSIIMYVWKLSDAAARSPVQRADDTALAARAAWASMTVCSQAGRVASLSQVEHDSTGLCQRHQQS
jgi:hypothetical protein